MREGAAASVDASRRATGEADAVICAGCVGVVFTPVADVTEAAVAIPTAAEPTDVALGELVVAMVGKAVKDAAVELSSE